LDLELSRETGETGWLANLIYVSGAFHTGLAMFASSDGTITRFSADSADLVKAHRLPHRAIVPGLVNVHSHAFQRAIRGRTEYHSGAGRDTFWTWREKMYHVANQLSPEALYAVSRMAFLEMLLSGITTVGEFHYMHHAPGGAPYEDRNLLARQVLRGANEVGLRTALLRTAYVRAGWHVPPNPLQARFITPRVDDFIADTEALRAAVPSISRPGRAWVGVAPHSIRAVPLDYLTETVAYARFHQMPVHMHVAEQPAEVEACLAEYGQRPVALLAKHGFLDARFTGIHGIHIDAQEVQALAAAGSRIAACPTTERNLGDGVAPAREMFDGGVAICFGSDSNVQIDLLEDARALEYHLRLNRIERVVLAPDDSLDGLARRLFACATEEGAKSIAGPGGSLEIGKTADFFTVDLNDASIAGAGADGLLNAVVFSLERTAIQDVCVAGEFVVRDRRHPLQEEIVSEFAEVQQKLWSAH
jgi:formimidoylglutamate deiminase